MLSPTPVPSFQGVSPKLPPHTKSKTEALSALQLPYNADTEHIKARLNNGELTLTVPKTETASKEKEIPLT